METYAPSGEVSGEPNRRLGFRRICYALGMISGYQERVTRAKISFPPPPSRGTYVHCDSWFSGIDSAMSSTGNSNPQQQWEYPLYAIQKGNKAQLIRSLSEEDLRNLQLHNKMYFDARNRFLLFEIMKRNYGEWERFIKTLENPELRVRGDAMTELDRLMLNFLSSVNALFNHFKVHFSRVPLGDDSKKKFDGYVRNLEKTNANYAFFADLRDFVQHCGLPVSHMQRTQDCAGKIALTVTTEASCLVENCVDWRRAWRRSGLTKDSGSFDLVSMMKVLRQTLIEDFGKFTASIYGPPLIETHNFFATLDIEAEKALGDGAQMVVVDSFASQPGGNGAVHFQIETSFLPRDVFKEVGITLTPNPTSHP